MEKSTIKKLLTIAILGLEVGGLILVLLSIWGIVALTIWGTERSVRTLPAGLFCVVLGNLFNLIRIKLFKDDKK